jgi:GPH family glycoside/pentoside/hexuronide:cation symporter
VVTAGIALVAVVVTVAGVWKRSRIMGVMPAPPVPLAHVLPSLDKRPLLILLAAYFVATLGQGLNSTLALYYYRYRLALDEDALGAVLVVFIVALCLTLPAWVKRSHGTGKTRLVAAGTLGLGLLSVVVYPLLPAGGMAGPLMMAVLGGMLLGSTGLLDSLLVDIAEACRVPADMMGRLFGIWKFVSKAARALAIALGGVLLETIGYTAGGDIPGHVAERIGWLFGPGVGLFFVLAGCVAWRLHATEQRARDTHALRAAT